MGRLVNWHKSQGHNYEYTKSDVLRWNEKCRPHEVENILLDNFNRYWSEDYRLLGCVNSITDIKDRQSLANVCDRAKCLNNGNMPDDITVDCIKISKALLSKQRVRKMTGYHYLLLTLIYKYQYDYGSTGFTVRNLKKKLKENMRKCLCMSDDTIKRCLEELKQWNIIVISHPRGNPNSKIGKCKLKITKQYREYNDGYIQVYYSACKALKEGKKI